MYFTFIVVLSTTFWLHYVKLWGDRPYGAESEMQQHYFIEGRKELWLTFSPTIAFFLWISILAIRYGIVHKNSKWKIIKAILIAWPLITYCLAYVAKSDNLLIFSAFIGLVFSIMYIPASYFFSKLHLTFFPAIIHIAWVFHGYYYLQMWFEVYGD